MTNLDDLLQRVRAKAYATAEQQLPSPATAEEVAQAESVLGFSLPPLLVRLYREVANGGFGPDYQLLPLVGEGRTAVSVYREERADSEDGTPHWPADVLPVLDWGCGMFAAVDCRSAEGAVLLFEPNGVDDEWSQAWYVDAEGLAGWLETWLSGTGWYEEDAGEDGGMRPWEAARQRLSASG